MLLLKFREEDVRTGADALRLKPCEWKAMMQL